LLGIWIQRLTLGWHAWLLSESPVVVGVVSALQFLPVIILSPFFGVVVDRIKARSGALVTNTLMALVAAVLGVATLVGVMTIELLIVLAMLHGVCVSFFTPARFALMPDLVPRHLFQSAVAIQAIVFNLSRFVGPGLAGFVVAAWGIGWAYIINALTYLPVLFALAVLRIDHGSKRGRDTGPYLEQLKEGIQYARADPNIRQAILMALAGTLFGRGVLELMPAFAAIEFVGGSNALAALMVAAGLGAVAASFAMSTSFLQVRLQSLNTGGCIAVSMALVILGITDSLYVGIFAVALLGLAATFVDVGSQALIQVRVENRLRARVMSLWTLVGMGGPAIGSVLGGLLLREAGVLPTTVLFASICLALTLYFGRRPSH